MKQKQERKLINGLFIFLIFVFLVKLFVPIFFYGDIGTGRGDFAVFYAATQGIREGSDIYSQDYLVPKIKEVRQHESGFQYLYPPFFAFLITPLSLLSFNHAAYVWIILNVAFIIFSTFFLVRIINNKFIKKYGMLIGAIILLFFIPLQRDIHTGNVDCLILFLLTLSYYLFRKDKQVLSGLSLAIAVLIKIFPLVFIIYFIYKKKYKIVLSLIGFVVVLGLLFPWPPLAMKYNSIFFGSSPSFERMSKLQSPDAHYAFEKYNTSLRGVIHRTVISNKLTISAINLSNTRANIIYIFIALVFIVLGLYVLFKNRHNYPYRKEFEFSLLLLVFLFLSPQTHVTYLVILIIPLFLFVFCTRFLYESRLFAIIFGVSLIPIFFLERRFLDQLDFLYDTKIGSFFVSPTTYTLMFMICLTLYVIHLRNGEKKNFNQKKEISSEEFEAAKEIKE